jgi:hypothetical protein
MLQIRHEVGQRAGGQILVMMSNLLTCFLCALVFQPTASLRLNRHSLGLEQEHEQASGKWPVTKKDLTFLAQLQTKLNPPEADVPWKWEKSLRNETRGKTVDHEWTYQLLLQTDQDAKGALVLHMLHSHGLAPLLASYVGKKFANVLQQNLTGESKAKALVEAQEEFGTI